MMTVAEERARLLRDRLEVEGLRDRAETIRVDWRSYGVVLRVVLFVLACIGLAAFYFFLDLMQMLRPGIVTGAAAIALAELLIHRLRWLGTGIEEALWIGGMFALVSELPRSGEPESLLVLATAAAIAGLRVRNPLFGALAAAFVVQYFELRFDRGVVVALTIATVAVLALLRTWSRPSTEWLWIALAVAMPVVGRFEADPTWRDVTIILYGGYAALMLTLAVRKRHHAFFAGGGIALAIAATDFAQKIEAPLEAKLAAAGATLLAASWFISRALRERSRGFVLTPVKLTTDDDALDIATTLVSSGAASSEHAEPTEKPGGGRFGGAGATGDY